MSEAYLTDIKDSIASIISSYNDQKADTSTLIETLFDNIDKTNHQQNDIVVDMITSYLIKFLNTTNAKDLDTSFKCFLYFLKNEHTITDKLLISKIVALLNKFTIEFDLVNSKSPYFYEFKYFFFSKYCIMSFYGNFLYNNSTEASRFKYNDTILSTASRSYNRNATFIEKYNNAMLLLDNPAMTILNTLHSRSNGAFNNDEDAISPNSKTIINVITTCMEAFQEKIRYFKKFAVLEAFNDTKTLSLSIKDFYSTLKLRNDVFATKNKLGVDPLEFIANSEHSSVADLQFLYEPITENLNSEDLNLDMSLNLKNMSPEKMALAANSVVYVKFLTTVFLIKVKTFLRYLQDFRTLFTDVYAIFTNNPLLLSSKAIEDVKITLKNSILRNSLHFLKNVLIKEYKNFYQQLNYQTSPSAVFIDTSLEFMLDNAESNSFDFRQTNLTNTIYTPLNEPVSIVRTPYHFKKADHIKDRDSKFKTRGNYENLNKKFDELSELALSGPIDKTQDDWCAFNILYKFSPNDKNVEISKLENFKNSSYEDVLSKVYDDNTINENKQKLKNEIDQLASKQTEIQADVTSLKEASKIFDDMQYLSNAEFLQTYKDQFETKVTETDVPVITVEKPSSLKEHSGQKNSLVFKSYPQRILTADEDDDIFIDTKEQHQAAETNESRTLRTSRRVQSKEEGLVNEDGTMSNIQFLLPKKSYKEKTISDEDFEDEDTEDTKFKEAKKNLQLKEAELNENLEGHSEEEDDLKSEYDEECLKNTNANNHSDVSDLKALKKFNVLDTEELKEAEAAVPAPKRRLRSSSQEPEENENKRVKLSE